MANNTSKRIWDIAQKLVIAAVLGLFVMLNGHSTTLASHTQQLTQMKPEVATANAVSIATLKEKVDHCEKDAAAYQAESQAFMAHVANQIDAMVADVHKIDLNIARNHNNQR